jgi:hypothetical protein
MQITRTSRISGVTRTLEIPVSEDRLRLWQSGISIEAAMPELCAADREFVMTGITDEEWQEFCKEID